MITLGRSDVFMVVFSDEHGQLSPRHHRCRWEPLLHGPASPGPPPCRAASLTARPSPLRRVAVSSPVSRHSLPSPVRRRHASIGSSSSAIAEPRRRRAVPPPRARAMRRARGPCQRRAVGRAPAWPRATLALCDWAERDFGPLAPG
jgi:hypothetical protein